MTTCKNCNNVFEGNFCNNCGQKAKTARLDWHYISDEAKYTFLHFNGGLTYTLKQLITRPGHSVREFVQGKRVKHYKPLLLLFVLAGFYGLLMHYIDISQYFKPTKDTKDLVELQTKITQWLISHYSLLEIFLLPGIAFASWLAFKRSGYNYIEHFILNAFLTSLRVVYSIAIFPLIYLTAGMPNSLDIHFILAIPSYILTFWAYRQFFNEKTFGQLLGRLLLMLLIWLALMTILLIVGIVIAVLLFPESIKN